MSDLLGSVVSGAGRPDFATRGIGNGFINTGIQTTVTVTPPTGQRVRLTNLASVATAASVTGVTVAFGGLTAVFNDDTIYGPAPSTTGSTSVRWLSIGSYQEYAAGNIQPTGNYEFITGGVDEALTIQTNVAAASPLFYAYEFGE